MGYVGSGDELLGEKVRFVRELLGAYPGPKALSKLDRRKTAMCALQECLRPLLRNCSVRSEARCRIGLPRRASKNWPQV